MAPRNRSKRPRSVGTGQTVGIVEGHPYGSLKSSGKRVPTRPQERGLLSIVHDVISSNSSSMHVGAIIESMCSRTPAVRPRESVDKSVRVLLLRESSKQNGVFVRIGTGQYDLRQRIETRLRRKVITQIRRQGLQIGTDGSVLPPASVSKEFLRGIHARARA